jgi:hypothetical protein
MVHLQNVSIMLFHWRLMYANNKYSFACAHIHSDICCNEQQQRIKIMMFTSTILQTVFVDKFIFYVQVRKIVIVLLAHYYWQIIKTSCVISRNCHINSEFFLNKAWMSAREKRLSEYLQSVKALSRLAIGWGNNESELEIVNERNLTKV